MVFDDWKIAQARAAALEYRKRYNITSPILGKTESYLLPESPVAMSMGQIVDSGKPLIWMTKGIPFHVTDPSKLQVICPLKYRLYAD